MNHEQAQPLLQAYADGELDLVRTLELEQHLHSCEICSRAYQNQRALHSALSEGSLYYRAPATLSKRIQASVRQTARPTPQRRVIYRYWLAFAALAIVALVIVGLVRVLPTTTPDNQLADQVLASHLRSLMVTHLTDVASSDQHTVKPWFDGKVDFSPEVVDLADQGFPLIGGRLDYLDNRTVAALVYKRRLHIINLFIWPTSSADSLLHTLDQQGYHLIYWNKSGMTYWAVSDLSTDELQTFVQLYQQRAVPTPTP